MSKERKKKEVPRRYELGDGEEGQHKRRKVGGQTAVHRGRQAGRWSKEQWRRRCQKKEEEVKERAAEAVARILSVGTDPADEDPTAG